MAGRRVRLGAVILGWLGVLVALLATWTAAQLGVVTPVSLALAVAACLVGALGVHLVAAGRSRLGALLLIEASFGLRLTIAEQTLVSAVLLLLAVLFTLLEG
jgi:hypothetical protein